MPVAAQGFAFVEDIVYALGDIPRYHLKEYPSAADIMFIVSTQERGRYEATSLRGTSTVRDLLVRTVQGHSGHVARQIDPDQAHERVYDKLEVPVLVHHTNSQLSSFWVAQTPLASFQGGRLASGTRRDAIRSIVLQHWSRPKAFSPTNSANAAPTVPFT